MHKEKTVCFLLLVLVPLTSYIFSVETVKGSVCLSTLHYSVCLKMTSLTQTGAYFSKGTQGVAPFFSSLIIKVLVWPTKSMGKEMGWESVNFNVNVCQRFFFPVLGCFHPNFVKEQYRCHGLATSPWSFNPYIEPLVRRREKHIFEARFQRFALRHRPKKF